MCTDGTLSDVSLEMEKWERLCRDVALSDVSVEMRKWERCVWRWGSETSVWVFGDGTYV